MKYFLTIIIISSLILASISCQCSKIISAEKNRNKASELYEQALKLEAKKDYEDALRCYEQSLKLYEDAAVKAAYFRLLATVGPK